MQNTINVINGLKSVFVNFFSTSFDVNPFKGVSLQPNSHLRIIILKA